MNNLELTDLQFLTEDERDMLNTLLEIKTFPVLEVYLALLVPKGRAKLEKTVRDLSHPNIPELSIKEIYEQSEIEWKNIHKFKELAGILYPTISKVLSKLSEEQVYLLSKVNLVVERYSSYLNTITKQPTG